MRFPSRSVMLTTVLLKVARMLVMPAGTFSHHRDLECGGNAAALDLFATDSSRGTSPRSNRSAESQSAAAGGALQMAFKMMHHLLAYKGVGESPGFKVTIARSPEGRRSSYRHQLRRPFGA